LGKRDSPRFPFFGKRGLSLCFRLSSAHVYGYVVFFFAVDRRDDVSFNVLTVYIKILHAFFHMSRVFDVNVVDSAAVGAGQIKISKIGRDARINGKPVVSGFYAQDRLGNIHKGPGGSPGQPAVLCLAVTGSIGTGDHLGIAVGLCAVNLADVLDVGGTGPAVDLKSPASAPDDSLRDGDPGIIVTEDTGILLISRRIGGDFPKVQIVFCICRLKDHDAVFGIQPFSDRVKSLPCKPFLYPDAGNDAEALGFDIDLSFRDCAS